MLLFLEFDSLYKTFSAKMDFLKHLKKFKNFEETRKFDSFWTLDDDYSQASLSTTSLSIDTDEFKYMDDDSESSSSDEIYSLETSLIEVNHQEEPHLLEDKGTHNQNWCYQHQSSPMVGRTINFYDNDNFTDDTLSQLANKGFAQSLARQNFLQRHTSKQDDASLNRLLSQLKDKRWTDNNNTISEKGSLHKKIGVCDNLFDHLNDFELMDNEDLQSISSHGSDRSTTPVETQIIAYEDSQTSEHNNSADSNLLNCRNKFGHKPIHFVKPKLLIFTDSEDIGSLSPEDDLTKFDHEEETDEEDNSTICGDNWKDYQDIDVYKETLYHQPPKSADRSAAQRLARRLYDLDGFKLGDVSKHLSKRNDFSQLVGEEFANFFDFTSLTLDSALRKFLEKFILCGDTQERERVIHHFSRRYVQCNGEAYNCEEACHTLVCAVMLLNTDLHGSTINRKMSCEDFVVSMSELNGGENFNQEELIHLFNSVLDHPIRWNLDNELIGLIQQKVEYTDFNKQLNTTNFNFFLEVPSEATSKEYMSGYLLRKCIKESHFRRTSIGKRGWKLYFGRLQDLTLYLYKDEISLNGSLRHSSRKLTREKELCKNGNSYSDPVLTHISPNNSVEKDSKLNGSDNKRSRRSIKFLRVGKRNCAPSSIKPECEDKSLSRKETAPSSSDIDSIGTLQIYLNHAFASKATDYSKKRNVFRLQVSSGSEYLFQVNEPREVELWVDCLNFVAALLSPPVFSNYSSKDISDSSASSAKKSNSVLTTLNIKEQLESHQKCVLTLEQDLMHLNSNPPSKSDKTKLKWQYNRQRKFIERELIRYKTYCRLLEFELIHLHNLAIARVNQQAFIDPYLIPVQYSQLPGASPMFYNQQTNQFVPLNCVQANVPVFQYHPGYGGPTGTVNNSSIKELSEDCSPSTQISPQEPINIQPVIIRPSYSCSRNSRSQINMNKRRRYRNNSLQQQQQQPIIMHYNPSVAVSSNKKYLCKSSVNPSSVGPGGSQDDKDAVIPYPSDIPAAEDSTPKISGNSNNNKLLMQPLPNRMIQQSNGGTTFYEIL